MVSQREQSYELVLSLTTRLVVSQPSLSPVLPSNKDVKKKREILRKENKKLGMNSSEVRRTVARPAYISALTTSRGQSSFLLRAALSSE